MRDEYQHEILNSNKIFHKVNEALQDSSLEDEASHIMDKAIEEMDTGELKYVDDTFKMSDASQGEFKLDNVTFYKKNAKKNETDIVQQLLKDFEMTAINYGYFPPWASIVGMQIVRGDIFMEAAKTDLFYYIQGKTLDDRKNIYKKVGQQISTALNYLHNIGWLHRDVKLENILVMSDEDDEDDRYCLADFDLSIKKDDFNEGLQGKAGYFVGTPDYVGPIPDDIYSNPRLWTLIVKTGFYDWWALHVTLFTCLNMRFPFRRNEHIKNVSTWENTPGYKYLALLYQQYVELLKR